MLATSAGIGLFLAFIGLQATQGLGLSVYSPTTVVTIGALRLALLLRRHIDSTCKSFYLCCCRVTRLNRWYAPKLSGCRIPLRRLMHLWSESAVESTSCISRSRFRTTSC